MTLDVFVARSWGSCRHARLAVKGAKSSSPFTRGCQKASRRHAPDTRSSSEYTDRLEGVSVK
jgi:hypothetical protein